MRGIGGGIDGGVDWDLKMHERRRFWINILETARITSSYSRGTKSGEIEKESNLKNKSWVVMTNLQNSEKLDCVLCHH